MKGSTQYIIGLFITLLCCSCAPTSSKMLDRRINFSVMRELVDPPQETAPRVIFKKFTSEDAKNILKSETALNSSLYKLESQGFKPGARYCAYRVDACFRKNYLDSVIANENGQLVSDTTDPNCTHLFKDGVWLQSFLGFMNGEPYNLTFVNQETPSCITATLIPNPITHTWSDGSCINLLVFDKYALDFVCTVKGLQPHEPLRFTLKGDEQETQLNFEASKDGAILTLLNPAVVGKKGGEATLTVERKQTGETTTLTYFWGTEAARNKSK